MRIPKRPKAPEKCKPILPTDGTSPSKSGSQSKRADISTGKNGPHISTTKEIPAKKKATKFVKTSRPSNSSSAIGSSTEEDVEKGSSNNFGQKIKSSVEGLIKGGNGGNTSSSAASWSAVKESRKKLQASVTKLIKFHQGETTNKNGNLDLSVASESSSGGSTVVDQRISQESIQSLERLSLLLSAGSDGDSTFSLEDDNDKRLTLTEVEALDLCINELMAFTHGALGNRSGH